MSLSQVNEQLPLDKDLLVLKKGEPLSNLPPTDDEEDDEEDDMGDEEDETEEEAVDRIRGEISDRFDSDMQVISQLTVRYLVIVVSMLGF